MSYFILEFIRKYGYAYNKMYQRPLEKILAIAWSIWICRNNMIFRNCDISSVHIINLNVNLFDTIRIYNIAFRVVQDCIAGSRTDQVKKNWRDFTPPPENWIKINVDVSWSKRATCLGYDKRDDQAWIVMAKDMHTGDCPILMVGCLAVHESKS